MLNVIPHAVMIKAGIFNNTTQLSIARAFQVHYRCCKSSKVHQSLLCMCIYKYLDSMKKKDISFLYTHYPQDENLNLNILLMTLSLNFNSLYY